MSDAIDRFPALVMKAFNTRDVEALIALLSPDFVYVDATGESRGHDVTRAREETIWTAFPDITATMTPFARTDTTLALNIVMAGTHSGPFPFGDQTIEGTCRKVETRLAAHFVFENGLAVSEHAYYDRLALASQLGLIL